jgi:hypothetical protein
VTVPWSFYPGLERKPGEELSDYTERWLARQKQYRPWESPKPIEPPKEQPRMPYVDREPGSDDE